MHIQALFLDGVFRPDKRIELEPGTRVELELKEVRQPTATEDLSDVEAVYARIDEKYPAANVRAIYKDRSELHER